MFSFWGLLPIAGDGMHASTLLIVEDEDRMRRLFELVLKPAGYELLFARSGAEAISLIQDHGAFDMIITDLQLGDLSGMDVLEAAQPTTARRAGPHRDRIRNREIRRRSHAEGRLRLHLQTRRQ